MPMAWPRSRHSAPCDANGRWLHASAIPEILAMFMPLARAWFPVNMAYLLGVPVRAERRALLRANPLNLNRVMLAEGSEIGR
ncbi:hypothetical protein FHS81_001425 [Pseudochelatococcus contaminans]|uniref:Uncharacterized protein n=1 Tax=Pseudochelatococcus contaminans TaxID=1538103 RepID=A0A7W6EGB3_9HYPH|nr:hypothetical protein [Pseudochelatococcus contaminans]